MSEDKQNSSENRNLYEKCVSLVKLSKNMYEEDNESSPLSLVASASNGLTHVTSPSFVKDEDIGMIQRSVYYISDLHLVHHITNHFKEDVPDDCIRQYIHSIVMSLFDGEFGNDIRSFETPIVLFGGDISSMFSVGEIFYRDFISTWEHIVDEEERRYSRELSPLYEELDSATKLFSEWKEKHPWAKEIKKPLEEYSDKRVPRSIKELCEKIEEINQQIDDRIQNLGLSYCWKDHCESTKKHEYVYSILGNHELWDFNSYEDCECAYRELFDELNIVFLNNKICSLGTFRRPQVYKTDPKTGRVSCSLLRREDDPKTYDEMLFHSDGILIVGGLGFAAYNYEFNADQGIYRTTIQRDEELKRGSEWLDLFNKARMKSKKYHCALVVLSHNPISDWMERPEECSNCFVFSGHTHRNVSFFGENNTFVIADNQVGYKGKRFCFKRAVLHMPRNPFASDPDGLREISCDEFKEYNLYVCDYPKTGTIEYQMNLFNAKLYVIKQEGYVGFFLSSPKGIYICNGGSIKKIGGPGPLEPYKNSFMTVINKYLVALSPLRKIQEQLSSYIKSFGGDGTIHGTIVDIDDKSHVMVNTSDGSLLFYYSPFFGVLKAYPNIGSLIHAHCPELEEAYLALGNTQLIPKTKGLTRSSKYEFVDIKNSPYGLSRRVNALQRLFNKQILRAWNPEFEIRQLED